MNDQSKRKTSSYTTSNETVSAARDGLMLHAASCSNMKLNEQCNNVAIVTQLLTHSRWSTCHQFCTKFLWKVP